MNRGAQVLWSRRVYLKGEEAGIGGRRLSFDTTSRLVRPLSALSAAAGCARLIATSTPPALRANHGRTMTGGLVAFLTSPDHPATAPPLLDTRHLARQLSYSRKN